MSRFSAYGVNIQDEDIGTYDALMCHPDSRSGIDFGPARRYELEEIAGENGSWSANSDAVEQSLPPAGVFLTDNTGYSVNYQGSHTAFDAHPDPSMLQCSSTSSFTWSPGSATNSELGANTVQRRIQTRRYSSLENALGPDAPWFKHTNQVTMAADGGSGVQVGSQPNKLNNGSHDEDETPITDGETSGATVEKLLDGGPAYVPIPASLASLFDHRGRCKLRNAHNPARPCHQIVRAGIQARSIHVMVEHFSDELRKIRSGELEVKQAHLLFSEERVRRAEEYEWVCPVPECTMATFTNADLVRHVHMHHNMTSTAAFLRRRGSGHDQKGFREAVLDVLTVY